MFETKNEKNMEGPGTIVGSNVHLTGTLKDSNDITVHGKVEGEVTSDNNILIEKNADIKGPVTAQSITVAGKINGEVKAFKKLEILETGKIVGSISTKDLVIKSGAILNGKSKMIEDIETKTEGKKPEFTKTTKSLDHQKTQSKTKEDEKLDPKITKKYELE